jgi:hypothetical protein
MKESFPGSVDFAAEEKIKEEKEGVGDISEEIREK